ncbi:MAG TPA: DUF2147 domain-containing protein [Steroidobacteraceae bacterium]|jgi:uncharacterized protein (DUF2147 family)|nr:DUF2147 domain-containing protein [Steroidobacteraceae bacterium]
MTSSGMRCALVVWLACCALVSPAQAADPASTTVVGNWLTEPRDGIIQVTVDAKGNLEGRIVGGNHPGLKDEKNPDPARRALVLRGQVILRNMKYEGEGRWSGGTVYKPDNGSTYKCTVTLVGSDVLKVRGYIGFALLGITQKWTRYTGTSMDLPPAH